MMRGGLVLLVRSLDHGGAQVQLVLLAKTLHRRGIPVEVVTFYSGGALEQGLTDVGVPIVSLQKSRRWDIFPFIFGFVKYVRSTRPSVIYSFLPEANLVALLARAVCQSCRVAWGLRASDLVVEHYDWLLGLIYWLEARLSYFADVVIANSEAGRANALKRGFRPTKLHVITNGVDAQRFRFDPHGRQRLRAYWGVQDEEVVFGLVARLDPMKNHKAFLRAAAQILPDFPKARFVCVGGGPTAYLEELGAMAQQLNVQHRLVWLGARDDMPSVNSAFDVGCSVSMFGEGFSNAIAEAMACQRPCIVTDVGDSAVIVGQTGWVVPRGNEHKLAEVLTEAARMKSGAREALGQAARERIIPICSIEALCDRTLTVLKPLGLARAKPPFQEVSPPPD